VLDHAIFWHVYPLGATGAPLRDWSTQDEAHRLPRLINWLDHLIELGCNGLLLAPVFASSTHGYDTLDHFRVDPRLGDDADFDRLIAACRERGIEVLLDGVFNHVGIHHPMVDGGGPIRRLPDGSPEPWEGHGDLALLDHDDPRTAELVVDVMNHWLDRGIAGWRLDVAYSVPTWFWAQVVDRVRQRHPDAVFLGEIIHGDYAALITEGHLDTVTQYELWKAIWSSIRDVNFFELAHALERHREFMESGLMQTFVGNHDVDRIASTVGEEGAALAAVLLLTLPGVPSIYYGDEQAFQGVKGTGFATDDALRPVLPETPAVLSLPAASMFELHRELIALRRRHPWLTRGQVEVLDTVNGAIRYAVTGDGHRLEVRLTLAPATAELVFDDGESFARSW
jgi:cyclomaltodextrinase / maltogenic alpha-amylase / neopullulanase